MKWMSFTILVLILCIYTATANECPIIVEDALQSTANGIPLANWTHEVVFSEDSVNLIGGRTDFTNWIWQRVGQASFRGTAFIGRGEQGIPTLTMTDLDAFTVSISIGGLESCQLVEATTDFNG